MPKNNGDKDETKVFKTIGNKKGKRPNVKKDVKKPKNYKNSKHKNKKEKKKSQHPKLKMCLKIFLLIFLLLCVIGAGIVAGMFFGLFGNEFEISKEELKIGAANSIILDSNGNVIANLSGDEKRKVITLEDMAEYLPKAYVAIEDERFYSHSGVDMKRTGAAIFKNLTGGGSFGGSTITQQLVKNITKDDETKGMAGIMRKVKEWAKAFQVERMISKDQILELYLNILYVGGEGNLHGVELGSEYYFNKSAKDLDLAECAFLAGINTSPNYYNPYKLYSENDTEEERNNRIKSKILTVLGKMKELNMIESQEEYDAAVARANEGLTFSKGVANTGSIYSYHTDAVIDQVINQVMEEKNISRELAENYVYSSGLKIYSTVDAEIQARLEEEYMKSKYVITSPSKKQTSQSGMAIVDYKTGKVVGIAGGLGEKNVASGWNRATQMVKQTGSSMKPIATIAPGLEEKVITAATVYDDAATDFGGGYQPHNYNRFMGLVNIRSFIETSQNIPALKILKELTPAKSLVYLQKMGITSLDSKKDDVLSLAIGGMTDGVSPLEMAVAYGTIANGGVYISPTFYTKVEDSKGNVVLTPNQIQTKAISPQNAYITTSIIEEPVLGGNGTAKYCKVQGIDTAAKTGTTDDDVDRWLCGFTPYYSAACWFGYDESETVIYNGGNPAGLIWSAVMKDIHANLPNANFTRPDGIVEETVCRTTGCLATTGCTNTYTEIFTADNLPDQCEGHGAQIICSESGGLATEYCSQYTTVIQSSYGASIPKENLNLWTPLNGRVSSSGSRIGETCTMHTKPKEIERPVEVPKEPEKTNTVKPNENKETEKKENTSSEDTKPENTSPEPSPESDTKPKENTQPSDGGSNTTP